MLIAQITDAHIVEKNRHYMADPATKIHERFFRVISYLNNLDPQPDLILFTGDTVDRGGGECYIQLKELLEPLRAPLYVIPGNHDVREEMRSAFYNQAYMPLSGFIQYAIEEHALRLIALDTLVQGQAYGMLCEERLAWIEKTLEQEPAKPTLLFMHHSPAKIGVSLFDAIHCKAPSQFEALVRNYKNIVGILAGHTHQGYVTSFGGKPCLIAPSIAPSHYIASSSDEQVSALELEDPAVSLHEWHEGTVMISHVRRIKEDYRRIDWAEITRAREAELLHVR
jgi:3',5'-cyclic AMP phosphodiesterase CpdA